MRAVNVGPLGKRRMNEASSRSHSVFTFWLRQTDKYEYTRERRALTQIDPADC